MKLLDPDFSKSFHVYSDTSDYQLDATVVQDGNHSYTTHKNWICHNKTHSRGNGLLDIVVDLKAFKSMLLGQELVCHASLLPGSEVNIFLVEDTAVEEDKEYQVYNI